MTESVVSVARSTDGGQAWEIIGDVPVHPGTDQANYHEPHVVELPSGRLVGMIRIENAKDKTLESAGITSFSMMQKAAPGGKCPLCGHNRVMGGLTVPGTIVDNNDRSSGRNRWPGSR